MILQSVDLHEREIGREIEKFLLVTTRDHWKSLIQKYDATEGVFFRHYLGLRNPFVEGFRQYFDLLESGKSIWKHRFPELRYLAQKVFIINKIVRHVSDHATKQIIGRFKSTEIRSILHELTMATHFLRNKFDVEFIEYERSDSTGRTFDFLASKNSLEVEVECKARSYDAGRQIKRDAFYMLCDEILKQLGNSEVKCIVAISCAKNVGQNQMVLCGIAKAIKSATEKGEEHLSIGDAISITIHYLPLETIIDSEEKFSAVIQPHWTPQSHFATVSNKEMTIVIKVKSEDKDIVLKSLYKELKKSLDQFSKKRPSLICCHIEGIYPEQWEGLKGENGLAVMTTHLLSKETAYHIHTVSYSLEVETNRIGSIVNHSYPVLFFKNPNCSFYKDIDIANLHSLAR